MNDIERVLTFQLQDSQYYAIDALKVIEIIRKPELYEIPGLDTKREALFHFRNQALYAQNLDTAINNQISSSTLEKDNFIIVVETNNETRGFGIKSVSDIINLNNKQIFSDSEIMFNRGFIKGAFEDKNNKLIQIIDLQKITSIIDIETVFHG